MPETSAIAVRGLTYAYGAGKVRQEVLSGIDLEIEAGEVVILTGPSGSGKTTLLTLIGGLRTIETGSAAVLGSQLRGAAERSLTAIRKRIGYIFQAQNLVASLSAVENVELGVVLANGGRSAGVGNMRSRALAMLDAVGLAEHAQQFPQQMSGGQKQRVAVARALVNRPALVLADEPTAALDRGSGRAIAEKIGALAHESGSTVVLITHDHAMFDLADRIVTLHGGRMVSPTVAPLSAGERPA